MSIPNNSRRKSLEEFASQEIATNNNLDSSFLSIIKNLVSSSQAISREISRAGLNDIIGFAGNTNVHGEEVKKLDLFANDVITESMNNSGNLCIMGSEENEEPILIPENNKKGKYVLVFDPLDGSSNIDVNVTIGTIWGLYKRLDEDSVEDGNIHDLLQSGAQQVAAGYILFGPSIMFVYSTGNGVNIFTYEPEIREFFLHTENIKIPKKSSFYSINEGNASRFADGLKDYLSFVKRETEDKNYPYKARYIGSAVADFHRTLIYGGIFMYPMDKKNPNGKLRLIYEANPLAMLAKQAGGASSDGFQEILSITPDTLHGRVPLFIGSELNIVEVKEFISGEHSSQLK